MPFDVSRTTDDKQKRQVITRRDFRYWLERRQPRVSVHEPLPDVAHRSPPPEAEPAG